MCFVTSKDLPESKSKGFDLDFPAYSSSFIFKSKCNFSFSISMRSCCSNLSLSISLCFSLSCSSISNLIFSCSKFLFFLSTSYPLIPMFPALFCPLALLSHVSISLHALHFLPLFCSHVLTLIFPSQPAF